MKSTRKIFINALKFCKYIENIIRSNKLANSMRSKNMFMFWKEGKSHTNVLSKVATKVDVKIVMRVLLENFMKNLTPYLEYVIIQC